MFVCLFFAVVVVGGVVLFCFVFFGGRGGLLYQWII